VRRKPSRLEFEIVFWLGCVLPGIAIALLFAAVFWLVFFTH
jgi:hypothetical protein